MSYKKTVVTVICAIALLSTLVSCGGRPIDMVKNGTFNAYPDVTVGEMIDAIKDESVRVTWEQFKTDGEIYVDATITNSDTDTEILIHFIILDRSEGSWGINAVELDGEGYDADLALEEIFESYEATL